MELTDNSLASFLVGLVFFGMVSVFPTILLIHVFDEVSATVRRWIRRAQRGFGSRDGTVELLDSPGPFHLSSPVSAVRRHFFHRIRAIRYPSEGRIR